MAMVKMRHEKSKLDVSVLPAQVDNMRRAGWVEKNDVPVKTNKREVKGNGKIQR